MIAMITGPVAFIGDVHGWDDRLERVLDRIEGFPVFMGDLIDRGPRSDLVLDRVRSLVESGQAACLIGNHEFALARGLGVPALGIEPYPNLYVAWFERYGGHSVCAAYGIGDGNPDALRLRLDAHLPWMASLPWVLEGTHQGKSWIAVHAGMGTSPMQPQLAELRAPAAWWQFGPPEQPPALYSKMRARMVPVDLPVTHCVVSGHTPVPEPVVTRNRILCDTSGGLSDRVLSAVEWPSGRVVSSAS